VTKTFHFIALRRSMFYYIMTLLTKSPQTLVAVTVINV